MAEQSGKIYIGDARGLIYEIDESLMCFNHLTTVSGPVSAIAFLREKLFCGTWDGTVVQGNREVKLGQDPIKCICVFRDRLFVSVDKKLVVLSDNLEVLENYETTNKIFCMDPRDCAIYFGLGTGAIASYTDCYENEHNSEHNSTILSMRNGLSGCTAGELRKNGNVMFTYKGWIRSVWDADLFSCGRNVFIKGKLAYSHDDDVMAVIRHQKAIISIGLDYTYKIYEDIASMTDAEEAMLMEILNSPC